MYRFVLAELVTPVRKGQLEQGKLVPRLEGVGRNLWTERHSFAQAPHLPWVNDPKSLVEEGGALQRYGSAKPVEGYQCVGGGEGSSQ
jgi:hypothetical protein